jgi:SAM-dependent methyltransferase
MPSLEKNVDYWNSYEWRLQGDEWSRVWGGPDYQWWGVIFPRILEFLPTGTLLEIAPGYGRWTRYLVHLAERVIGVDVTENCVAACRERFAGHPNATFHLNDGTSLEAVEDDSIDFAFTFDSLVHADNDVVEGYVHELARKLKPDGVGFIHHSNLGVFLDKETGELPFENICWRGPTTATLFAHYCADAGLACIGQEIINWDSKHLIDCFSMITRPGSRFERPNRIRENTRFMHEATALREIAEFYGPGEFPKLEPMPASERAARLLSAPEDAP